MNPQTDKAANLLETIAAALGAVLAVIASFQHGGSPFAGTLGHISLTSLASAFGLHHFQTGK